MLFESVHLKHVKYFIKLPAFNEAVVCYKPIPYEAILFKLLLASQSATEVHDSI